MKRRCTSVLLAIVGGSGAGKTWLADRLADRLGVLAGRIALDDFYRDLSHLPPARRLQVNFDHPRAIDWPLLERVLNNLRAGRPTEMPRYDFATHCRRPQAVRWRPRRVVLCEGLWLLRRPSLRRLFDLSVFVECPAPLRLRRRIERDTRERGRTRASVLRQYRRDVQPMYLRYVEPQKKWAGRVLESPVCDEITDGLARHLKMLAAEPAL
jgi:uridine kinase